MTCKIFLSSVVLSLILVVDAYSMGSMPRIMPRALAALSVSGVTYRAFSFPGGPSFEPSPKKATALTLAQKINKLMTKQEYLNLIKSFLVSDYLSHEKFEIAKIVLSGNVEAFFPYQKRAEEILPNQWPFLAVVSGSQQMVAYSLDCRKFYDKNGWSPLFHAVWLGDSKIVLQLLNAGYRADERDNDGYTPMDVAAFMQYYDLLILLERYANVNVEN